MSYKDTFIGLLIVMIWGMNFVVIAWGLDDFPPLLLGASRFILIALLGSLFVRIPSIPWYWLAFYGLSIGFGQFAFLFLGMYAGMPAGLASLVLQSQVILTILLGVVLLKESVNSRQITALTIACVGLIVIATSVGTPNLTILGFSLSVIAAMFWALGNIVTRMIVNKGYKIDLGLVVWSAWFVVPPFIVTSFIFEGSEKILLSIEQIKWGTVLAILYLSVFASIVGFGLWSKLLSKYPASKVAPLSLGVPLFGFLSAFIFLGESISVQQITGVVIVFSGLIIIFSGNKKRQ